MEHYWKQKWIVSTMSEIAQNGQKRLIFTVVSHVRTEMRENVKEKKNMRSQWKNTNICISISVYSRTYGHINILSTETHMRMYPLLINQIR